MKTSLPFTLLLSLFLTTACAQVGCKIDSFINYDYAPGTVVKQNSTKGIYYYNANGFKVFLSLDRWNDATSVWDSWRRNNYTTNATGLPTVEQEEYYSSSTWYKQYQTTNTYNSSGFLTQELKKNWDEVTSLWINDYKTDFVVSAGGLKQQELRQNWNASTSSWENQYKLDYTYTAGALEIEELQVWVAASSSFRKQWKKVYTSNALGQATLSYYYLWNTGLNSYEQKQQTTYTYNTDNLLITTNTNNLLGSTGPEGKVELSYNTNGCQTISDSYTLNSNTSAYENSYQIEYFINSITSGIEEANTKASIHCYPNPAASYLTLNMGNQNVAANITITNAIGAQMPVILESKNAELAVVNIQNYAAGFYLVKVANATTRFIKE